MVTTYTSAHLESVHKQPPAQAYYYNNNNRKYNKYNIIVVIRRGTAAAVEVTFNARNSNHKDKAPGIRL